MARWGNSLEPAKTRLLVGVLLCAGFFIASSGVEEWCSTCYPHESAELTIINDAGAFVEVTLSGPVSRKMIILSGNQVTIRTRVGLYGYSYGEEIYDAYLNMSRFDVINFGQLYVAPEVKNTLILKSRRGD